MKDLLPIVREASKAILEVYNHAENHKYVDYKSDQSPLTLADKAAHEVIEKRLKEAFPHIPVLSEEGSTIPYEQRKQWKQFWLVDPLDGTKEFVKRTGEFTVNIALIENNLPTQGIIYVPVKQQAWYTHSGEAFMLNDIGTEAPEKIKVRQADPNNLAMVGSKDHAGPALKAVLERNPHIAMKSMGSSLKFCLLAIGLADIYYRDNPTMEWDTGAAQAILQAAGGQVITTDGVTLQYNKPVLTNPPFIALGDKGLNWKMILQG